MKRERRRVRRDSYAPKCYGDASPEYFNVTLHLDAPGDISPKTGDICESLHGAVEIVRVS